MTKLERLIDEYRQKQADDTSTAIADSISKVVVALASSYPRPIPVSERLPENRDPVYVRYKHHQKPRDGNYPETGWGMGYYQKSVGAWAVGYPVTYPGVYVTHWLDLPPDPEGV